MTAFDVRDRAILTIADDAHAEAAIAEALAAIDARALPSSSIAQAPERLAQQIGISAIAIDVTGVDDATALVGLDAVARAALDHGANVVASFSADQIDLVVGALSDVKADLLCDPGMSERVTALALLSPPSAMLHDATRDAEARRLRQLNDEVARIAETLARLTRSEGPVSRLSPSVAEPANNYRGPVPSIESASVTASDVRAVIRTRRLRDQFFDPTLFADPAWDMLLDLFAAHLEEVRVSVSSLCIAAAVPATTALRWITTMREAGLFERRDDPFDRRRAYIALTPVAVAAMRNYMGAARRAGLAIA